MSRQPRFWTPEEDEILRNGVTACTGDEVIDWCRIASKLPGRTNKDCRKRWHNAVADGLNKGQWTKAEDDRLRRGVKKHSQKKWPLIAEIVETRSADQCAKRWQQSLDPELDHSEWRDGDNKLLLQIVEQVGRQWTMIQGMHFPGRSKNAIKNRYSVLTRKKQRRCSKGASSQFDDDTWNTTGSSSKCASLDGNEEDGDGETIDFDPSFIDLGKDDAQDNMEPYMTNATAATSTTEGNLSSDWLYDENMFWGTDSPHDPDPATNSSGFSFGGNTVTKVKVPPTVAMGDDSPFPVSSSASQPEDAMWLEYHQPQLSNATAASTNGSENPAFFNGSGEAMLNLPKQMIGPELGPDNILGYDGKVHFTLTMNGPSVETMQLLIKIATETQARFRMERE